MALDPKELQKPLSKLRKLLKENSSQPDPKQVHDLRTNTRRVEAGLIALEMDQTRRGRQILDALAPIRKRAGKVRDMDVLTGYLLDLQVDGNRDAAVQVLEFLGNSRFRSAKKLHRTANKGRGAGKDLKRCGRVIARRLGESNSRTVRDWEAKAAADALRLSNEIAQWPELTTENLHPFRLKIKELQNVLRMSGEKAELEDELGKVKDDIGEWHDWTELASIARKVLKKSDNTSLTKQIDQTTKKKEERALSVARQLRSRYFNRTATNGRRGRGVDLKQPLLSSVAHLAAEQTA